jgi:hypothetical protein
MKAAFVFVDTVIPILPIFPMNRQLGERTVNRPTSDYVLVISYPSLRGFESLM